MSMGKTTVFVDEILIRHALRVTNLKTKKEVIEADSRNWLGKRTRNSYNRSLGPSIWICR